MDWLRQVVIPAISGSAAGLGVLAFLGKRLLEQKLAKDLERHRTELSERTEALKTQLSIRAHEESLAISRIDTHRSTAVRELFDALRGWFTPTARFVDGFSLIESDAETTLSKYENEAEQAYRAAGILTDTLNKHIIYLTPESHNKIECAVRETSEFAANLLRPIRQSRAEGRSHEEILVMTELRRTEFRTSFNQRIEPSNRELIAEFRRLLGIVRT
jgi:hypothetical protein